MTKQRTKKTAPQTTGLTAKELERMARSLVKRGLCTPQILEHPNTGKNTDDQE